MLKSEVEFIRPLAQQSGVGLELDESLGEVEIAADSSGLQQVLLNLACNALRHTRTGGKIRISGRVESRGAQKVASILFADTGEGIRPEHLSHLFEPGFTTTGQSPGLGLTVCHRIVEQHRGKISVDSQLGRGTVFCMEFPIL